MQSIVGNEFNTLNEDLIASPINLRAFRNEFFKYYIHSKRDLTAQDLSALLLYFALSFIDNKKGLAKLFKRVPSLNKKFEEFADNEMFLLGSELLSLLGEFLPINLKDIMVVPNKVAWQRAKQFFIEQNKIEPSRDTFFADIANLGFAYQIFSANDRKEKALPALQKANKKISKEELIAFTQLYTPNWVVDFLAANTVLRGSESKKISSRYSRWLIPDQNHIRKESTVELNGFTLLDPACGAGQFLFSAFDLLIELYEQNGCDRQTAAKFILKNNIFGADIDEKALWVAGLGLLSKYLVISDSISSMPDRLNNLAWVSVADINERLDANNFLGSIDNRLPDTHFLKNNYSVLLTNPPYIGRRCLSRELKAALKEQYPDSSADLSAAFLERCLTMLKPDGKLGIITQSSLMSIPSYKTLREYLLNNFYMQAAIHCGPGVFPLASGEKIDSILLLINGNKVLHQERAMPKTCFVDLSTEKNKIEKLESALNYSSINDDCCESNYGSINFVDQSAFAFGMPDNLLSQLSSDFYSKINKLPKLGDIADIRQGLATTDNGRFVRYHFDVDNDLIRNTWVPYIKGAGTERYASNNPFVVKWGKNGNEIKEAVAKAYPYLNGKTAWVVKNEEYYFRSGLCFSFINKSGLAVRRLPAGAIFDVASSAIFTLPEEEDFLLAYLNSRVVGLLARGINQTINVQVGDLKKIPIIPMSGKLKDEMSKLGNLAFETKHQLLDYCLLCSAFKSRECSIIELVSIFEDYLKSKAHLQEKLFHIQTEIDNKVINAMENQGIIDSGERKFLDRSLNLQSTLDGVTGQILSERQCAFKLLSVMVSKAVSSLSGDRVILLPLTNTQAIPKSFNLTTEEMSWLENKLEIPITKIFSRANVVDISKLAQEPSRYFVFCLGDYDACMLFSSSAARRFKKMSGKNLFVVDELADNLNLLNKVNMIWQTVFEKLDNIIDWTSKDLENAFQSIRI